MIHMYRLGGLNIVIDPPSGAVHVADELTYEILENIAMHTDSSTTSQGYISMLEAMDDSGEYDREVIAELRELVDEGLLYSDDDYKKLLPDINNRKPVVKALCLHIAHDCNLKCMYCFAGEGEYGGDRSLMSEEVGCKALDFLAANSGKRKNLEVDFFGGEPLINFDTVKKIVEYGIGLEQSTGKRFRFTLTTNGVLLDDEIIEFVNKHMHNVVLSIDGRPEVNDKMRPRAGGQGSYDVIMPNLKRFVERRANKDYYVRGTFTRENLDFVEDIVHLAEQGFERISVEPVVAPQDKSYAITSADIPEICHQYEQLAFAMTRDDKPLDIVFFHFMIDLEGGPCAAKRVVGCGAGTEYLAVTPDGELYPCHQFVGDKRFKMGDVTEGIKNLPLREKFESCNIYSKPECAHCWARFYCSGGCAANAFHSTGSINGTYEIGCALQKKRIECAIYIKALNNMHEITNVNVDGRFNK